MHSIALKLLLACTYFTSLELVER